MGDVEIERKANLDRFQGVRSAVWDRLPDVVRLGIVAMVKAVK